MTDQADKTNDAAPKTTGREFVQAADSGVARTNGLRWFLKPARRPLMFLLCGAALIVALGVAQRHGWITAGGGNGQAQAPAVVGNERYICPMMCTPPQSAPGRCPVCAMELVRATSGSGASNSRSIEIDPVARRVANIRTVPVRALSMTRTIRSIGEVSYDEGTLRTISAYVDGRIDRLYADFTGVVVNQGDHLALVYSPQLYSAQVELLLAKQTLQRNETSTRPGAIRSNHKVYESARQRLVELGMTDRQVAELEATGIANSKLHLCAPISGTVIEKFAVEGEYVNEGEPIYKLADLSTVWLMLELFPEDAAAVHYGQHVVAEVQSLPGKKFEGRVTFVDPYVDRETRTVGVRAVVPNDEGLVRVGDYVKATIQVEVVDGAAIGQPCYDPELAGKWISPRHPQIVESSPGQCPICGIDLVPAARFGFSDAPRSGSKSLVIPRDAVLMAGGKSVVYVETAPGRFEIRPVVLGTSNDNEIVVISGLAEGEQVATRGNFLIDSQMQLAGNPSLMDPTKAGHAGAHESSERDSAVDGLAEPDRGLARQQGVCPVTGYPLGSMGRPVKVQVNGRTVFICCEGCRDSLLKDPESYLAKGEKHANLHESDDSGDGLPPIGVPQIVSPPNDHSPPKQRPSSGKGPQAPAASEGGAANRMADRHGEGIR